MSHASVLVAIAPTDDVEEAVAEQMRPFDENGEWFGDGSRWDWYQIGGRGNGLLAPDNIVRRGDLDLPTITANWRARLTGYWNDAQGESADMRELLCGVQGTESLGEYLARRGDFPAHYAFLRNHIWQEKERMGWWGMPSATECERAERDTHICTFEKNAVRIVSWGDSNSWQKMFYPRFVEPLPPETLLVTVDYHV